MQRLSPYKITLSESDLRSSQKSFVQLYEFVFSCASTMEQTAALKALMQPHSSLMVTANAGVRAAEPFLQGLCRGIEDSAKCSRLGFSREAAPTPTPQSAVLSQGAWLSDGTFSCTTSSTKLSGAAAWF